MVCFPIFLAGRSTQCLYFDIFSDECNKLPNNYELLFTQSSSNTRISNHNLIGNKIFRSLGKEKIKKVVNDLNSIKFNLKINQVYNLKFNNRIVSFTSLETMSFLTNLNFMSPQLTEKSFINNSRS